MLFSCMLVYLLIFMKYSFNQCLNSWNQLESCPNFGKWTCPIHCRTHLSQFVIVDEHRLVYENMKNMPTEEGKEGVVIRIGF